MRKMYDNGVMVCPQWPSYMAANGLTWMHISVGRNEYLGRYTDWDPTDWSRSTWRKTQYFTSPSRTFEWACNTGSVDVRYYYEPLSFRPWLLHPENRAPVSYLDAHVKSTGPGVEEWPGYRAPLANGKTNPGQKDAHPWQ